MIIKNGDQNKNPTHNYLWKLNLVERLDGLIKKYTPPPAEKPSFEGEDE